VKPETRTQDSARQAYEPPVIRRIKLVPEEVAAGNCKAIQVFPNVCRQPGGILKNFTIGS
jgi:hypothetical protein